MIQICNTCKSENDQFAIVCKRCGGYIQNKIPVLNFFESAWKIVESPKKAFVIITLAEQKNYIFGIMAVIGIYFSFSLKSIFLLGTKYEHLIFVIISTIADGIIYGIVILILMATSNHFLCHLMGGKGKYKNSIAILSYSCIPFGISLLIISPLMLMTFGPFLFTGNPHPNVINPLSYFILQTLNVLMAIWFISLWIIGSKISMQITVLKSVFSVFISILFGAIILYISFVKLSLYF